MIALGIIILILILLLILPVGADAAYINGGFSLKVKIGPFRFGIPAKEKSGQEKAGKKAKKPRKKAAEQSPGEVKAKKPKAKLSFDDIMGIVRIGLAALGRFRRSISIDLLMLHVAVAGPDPYEAVVNYGRVNAALGAALPLLHRAFRVKKEDYDSRVDFEADKLKIDGRVVLSVRIGEILLIALCAAFGFIKWLLKRSRRAKAEAKAAQTKEKVTENSSAEKGI